METLHISGPLWGESTVDSSHKCSFGALFLLALTSCWTNSLVTKIWETVMLMWHHCNAVMWKGLPWDSIMMQVNPHMYFDTLEISWCFLTHFSAPHPLCVGSLLLGWILMRFPSVEGEIVGRTPGLSAVQTTGKLLLKYALCCGNMCLMTGLMLLELCQCGKHL